MRPRTATVLVAAGLTMVLAGCGSGETTPAATEAGNAAWDMGCDDGVAPIRELLRTEIPEYDYDPYRDLAELVDASDEIVTGTLLQAQRIIVPEPEDPNDRPMIKVLPAEATALKPGSGDGVEPFSYDAVWAMRNEPDPLADPVRFDPGRTRFIAFLTDHEGARYPHIQGFAVSCDPAAPAVPVFDPIPGTVGITIDEIDAAVLAITDPPPSTANIVTVPHRELAQDLDYGDAYTTTKLSARDVWAVAPEAELDTDSEVFIEFNVAESSTCPNGSLDRIEYNPDTARLYPVLDPVESDGGGCTDDDRPHVIIVAIAREHLPAAAFTATTGPSDNVGGLDAGYVSFEPGELTIPTQDALEHRVLQEWSPLAVGETGVILDATTHCGFERLFHPVDGRQWLLTDESAASGVPDSWAGVTRDQSIDLNVERVADNKLVVTARGTDDPLEYRPADDGDELSCA